VSTASPQITRLRQVTVGRLIAAGVAAAVLTVIGGFAGEWWWYGVTNVGAMTRIERQVRREFAVMTSRVQTVARTVVDDPAVPPNMTANAEGRVRALFDVAALARERFPGDRHLLAVTIYDSSGTARAWAGRPALPETTKGEAALFVSPSPLGLRLVYIQPILDAATKMRLGSAAVEHVVTPGPAAPDISAASRNFVMPTSVVPVSLRLRAEFTGDRTSSDTFIVTGPDGEPLVEAAAAVADIDAARGSWRRGLAAIVIAELGLTLLLTMGPLLDRRLVAETPMREVRLSIAIAAIIAAACAVGWIAFVVAQGAPLEWPTVLLVSGAGVAGLVATAAPGAVGLRVALRARRHWAARQPVGFVVWQLAWGVLLAVILAGLEWMLGLTLRPAEIDLRHFSLHPWSGARLAALFGLVLWHIAVLWAGTLGCVAALARWRIDRRLGRWQLVAAVSWIAPTVALAAVAAARQWAIPASAIVLAAAVCTMAALVAPRVVVWYRRTTVASRILAMCVAFLLPALLIYPSVHFVAERTTRHLIETQFAVEAMRHPQELQDRLQEALHEIDAMPLLSQFISEAAAADATASDNGRPLGTNSASAFAIWRQTVLARARLTSDVELYDSAGTLVSRFALNFPEYTTAVQKSPSTASCKWDVFGEAQPFGGQERNMLHAERRVCDNGVPLGSIVVHVVFDYRTLPFLSSQSAYVEVFRQSGAGIEDTPTGNVDFTVYGWGLTAIYTSGRSAWPLDESTFSRVYRTRQPFWTVLRKDDTNYNVYFANDRLFIYALGYARPDIFDHFVRLAELTTLAASGYALVLIAIALFSRAARQRPQTGRALLREIRVSFYRKLFLAFVLASIVPVLTLAFVIRAYFAGLLLDDIRAEASRTAAVAQRVIEESEAMLRRGAQGLTPYDDDVLVWIGQLIDQDVNIFYGPELVATSERDLFASGLLPTRTAEDVYRAIALERLPSYVSEDTIGGVPYLLAATPVRTGGREAILTVPLAFRQQAVERELDDLDRGLHLAALFFILLGAGIGLSMAERIADPVRRLTRATGRIARGDFDARIAVRSSDELRRLVDAFNSMAAELKAQRKQLERTHRIEAWAEMARQVAHEIKNPLTPIQLSAEHLRRVHADRGEPMGPVLESCVETILGQVSLLRQIASEFSSFASSPTARLAPADPVALVRDVVDPYRAGLADRIQIDNQVGPNLPAVLVDRTLVFRALANIFENALHAMPNRGRIVFTSSLSNGFVTIRVADTGMGMDPDALGRVFEPYFSTKTTGTGLGLPIARRNIELSGGTVDVQSEKGRGTTVTVTLPVAPAGSSDSPAAASA
jgi:signal transduction histidine kinase